MSPDRNIDAVRRVRRTPILAAAIAAAAIAATLLVGAGSASATTVHAFIASFGGFGSGPEQFNGPEGIAVNNTTHDVYVVDTGNNRVERFSSTGAYLGQFNAGGTYEDTEDFLEVKPDTAAPTGTFSEPTEIAVDNSTVAGDPSREDLYVIDRGHGVIDKFNPAGEYVGQITGAETPGGHFGAGEAVPRDLQGVAVGPSGRVWVTDTSLVDVYAFTDALANTYSAQCAAKGSGGGYYGSAAEGLAVDANEHLYFRSGGSFAQLTSGCETLSSPFGGDEHAFRVAVDAASGEVYLDNIEDIEAFNLQGEPIGSFGTGDLTFSKGVAVDESDGTVYVSDRTADRVSIFEAIALSTVAVGAPTQQSPRAVTLNGTVSPEGRALTSCVFEYATAAEYAKTKTYGHSKSCSPASVGAGSPPVAVSARLEGLEPEVSYHYRLVAANSPEASATSDHEFFTGPHPGAEYATEVTAGSATLHWELNPNGADTSYYLEYGPTAEYGSFAPVPAPGVDAGAESANRPIEVHIQDLLAGTLYHYRFVAVQGGEAFVQRDLTFITQQVTTGETIPDGRAWEMVSPPEKHGALIEQLERGVMVQAAADGDALTYGAQGPGFAEGIIGSYQYDQLLSKRAGAGWTTANLTLPTELPPDGVTGEHLFHEENEYRLFSSDLSLAVVEPQEVGTPLLSSEATERTLYIRHNDGEGIKEPELFQPLVDPANVGETPIDESIYDRQVYPQFQLHFLAGTPDLAHIVFETPVALPTASSTQPVDNENLAAKLKADEEMSYPQQNIYEWSGGELQLVNILPDGAATHEKYGELPVLLAGTGFEKGSAPRALSNDGERIAWTLGNPYDVSQGGSLAHLYVRDLAEQQTVQIGGPGARYQTMSANGSKIFYLEGGNLHVYDWETGTETDLTAEYAPGEANAGVQELVSDASEDGSTAYFVAHGVLAPGGSTGEDNLYLSREVEGAWHTVFIAALAPQDDPDWYGQATLGAPNLARITSRVSPNGRFLAFMSQRSLTGYDNADAITGEADEEVYLYDGDSGRLVCASCNPTGARPHGVLDSVNHTLYVDPRGVWSSHESFAGSVASQPDIRYNHRLAGSIPSWDDLVNQDPTAYQPRFLSNAGRLSFDSPDGLVPQDENGVEDVYEWEPEGIGSCNTATDSRSEVYVRELAGSPDGGCVALISSGTSRDESAFFDASESGDDVFFATSARLSSADDDTAYDIYDAHVCSTSAPCPVPSISEPPCGDGESCKGPPTPQPEIFGPPSSATFSGAGNVSAPAASPVVKKSLTRAQKLVIALRACRKVHAKGKRARCERQARRQYSQSTAKRAGGDRGSRS